MNFLRLEAMKWLFLFSSCIVFVKKIYIFPICFYIKNTQEKTIRYKIFQVILLILLAFFLLSLVLVLFYSSHTYTYTYIILIEYISSSPPPLSLAPSISPFFSRPLSCSLCAFCIFTRYFLILLLK